MNHLQEALSRLAVLVRGLSPQSRMVAGVAVLLIAIGAAYLLNAGVSGDQVFLLGDSSIAPHELIAMQAAFAKANLNDFSIAGERIRVPRAHQSQYLAVLADANALPHNFGDSMRKMLESSSPFVDRKRRDDMMKIAVQDMLSKVIMSMGYVEWATVMYDVQQPSFPNRQREVRACVTVKPRGQESLTPQQARKIQNVVGPPLFLSPSEVTLVDVQGKTYSGGAEASDGDAGHDVYATRQQEYERQYREKIEAALKFVPGALATVNVELHTEVENSSRSVKIDVKPPTADRPNRDPIHAPAILNGMRQLDLGMANAPATIDLTDAEGYEIRQVRLAGLTPKRVTVSIAVPRSYFEQQWRLRRASHASAQPDLGELANIEDEIRGELKRHVMQVLPMPQEENGQTDSAVTVTVFPTAPLVEIAQLPPSEPSFAWLDENRGLVIAAVSLVLGLLVLRSIVRIAVRGNSPPLPAGGLDDVDDSHELPGEPSLSFARQSRTLRPTAQREELSEFVRDNPGAAADVLRRWIGSTN
ncbi:MAG: hypothetical protein IT427_06360 [Pirellulales bacterium]|nr:hypothetical protein [Pirellulales bacterium]